MKARENPFCVDRVLQVRYKFSQSEWLELFRRLENLNYRAAIVGSEGSGKTTLLEDIADRLCSSGLVPVFWRQNLRVDQPSGEEVAAFFSCLDKSNVVLIDSAELLNLFSWFRFSRQFKKVRGVLISVHKEGRLPTLIKCNTSPELLGEILLDLLGEDFVPCVSDVDTLFHEHHGNIRDALRSCYDCFAEN